MTKVSFDTSCNEQNSSDSSGGESKSGKELHSQVYSWPVKDMVDEVRVELRSRKALDHYATNVGLTGMAVWFAASNLCELIANDPSILLEGDHVLELGSGTGLVGIFAASVLQKIQHSETRSLLLTDGEQEVVENLQDNLQLNGIVDENVGCKYLRWGLPQAKALLQEVGQKTFRVVLGADLLYGRESDAQIKDLFLTVTTLMEKTAQARFYLAYTRRKHDGSNATAIAESLGLDWWVHPDHTIDLFDNNTDGQTAFWRDAVFVFSFSTKSLDDAASSTSREKIEEEKTIDTTGE